MQSLTLALSHDLGPASPPTIELDVGKDKRKAVQNELPQARRMKYQY
jgi:hypothetical protein